MFIFKKNQTIAVFFMSLLLANQSFAASGPKISLYGGMTDAQTNKNNLMLAADETDVLVGGKRGSQAEFGVGLAYNFWLMPENADATYLFHSLSIGVDAYRWQAERHGPVLLFGDPTQADYRYHIHLKSSRYLINTELNFHPLWIIMPFIEVGAGTAHNRVSYHDTPVPGIPDGQVHLNAKSSNHFAYDLGAGVKAAITDHLEISLRYLYSNLGSVSTSKQGNITFSGTPFPITILEPVSVKLRTQSLLLGASYLIN